MYRTVRNILDSHLRSACACRLNRMYRHPELHTADLERQQRLCGVRCSETPADIGGRLEPSKFEQAPEADVSWLHRIQVDRPERTYTMCLQWLPLRACGQLQEGTFPITTVYIFPVVPAITMVSSGSSVVPVRLRSRTNILFDNMSRMVMTRYHLTHRCDIARLKML